MKAISLHQPYASLVGIKKTETRSWSTSYRGPLAICAAKRWTLRERDAWEHHAALFGDRFPRPKCVDLTARRYVGDLPPLGCVVALAQIVDVVQFDATTPFAWANQPDDYACGDFTPGRYGWLLADVRKLSTPLPIKGRQGLWTLTPEEASEVLRRAST